ncbi:N-6 DNA methylase [Micromonospora sp. CPCC 206171]|uniref:HsdM family class I SAM-dependent methyltransferase n=1 Tax=Micromonospora sp. CPCC 206171 TaxID=3122405 RepID=UPI002FF35B96
MTSAVAGEADRHAQLRALFSTLGYDENLVQYDYRYLAADATRRVDIAAFAQLPLDMSSAVMVGQVQAAGEDHARTTALGAASALAAPAAVVAMFDGLEVIAANKATLIQRVPYGERLSDRIVDELRADRLLQAKLRHPTPTLFSVDVTQLPRARRSAVESLRDRVVIAREAIKLSAHTLDFRLTPDSIARLLVNSLTSLFIEDKFEIEYQSASWWQEVQTRFTDLNRDLESFGDSALALFDIARDSLREGVDYRSLDSVVISDLYEPRLVDAGTMNENGVVYTPFELASRVLERVPVELIAPDERSVLDFACGSGTLLLAAHDRLKNALPRPMNFEQIHQYLVSNLHGWDRDAFAVRLTHLSLTLKGHPLGNGWDVQERDTLDTRLPVINPSIIFANPPWRGRRVGPHAGQGRRQRDDAATPFVNRALDIIRPDGLLALFVPAAWLTARHSADARRNLSRHCEILETWRLPEGAFPPAEVKGAVLIARARKPGSAAANWYVSRRIARRASLGRLYADGTADKTSLLRITGASDPLAASSPVTAFIKDVRAGESLASVANIRSGPPRGGGATGGQTYRWLGNVRALSHFGRVTAYNTSPAMYPGDFDARAAWSPELNYTLPKLLVSRVRRSNTPWKIKVGFAFEPVIPSNNQYAITLKDHLWTDLETRDVERELYALGGILGSALISTWIDDQVTTGNIPRELLATLPLPEGWTGIAEAAEQLSQAAETGYSAEARSALARDLDARVFDLYGAPEEVRRDVLAVMSDEQAPEGTVRYSAPEEWVPNMNPAGVRAERSLEYDGTVLAVADDGIRIWVDQLTDLDGVIIGLPQRLPAAAMLPGVTFKVRTSSGDLRQAEYRFHKSLYLDNEELFPLPAPDQTEDGL